MKWIPPFGATDPNEQYVNAAPTIPGSNPPADFFNTILNELLAVIVAADMTPDDTVVAQVSKAIVALAERAATSGVTKGGFWFGKTTANFAVPNPTLVEQNYIDFTTLNTYTAKADLSGWDFAGAFVPPTGIDYTILITSKFWDIPEQDGQQGGWAQYDHTDDEWTWWPRIVSFVNAALSGVSTAPTPSPASPNNQIANKEYVDTAITYASYDLFDNKWRDATTANIAWLLSDGEWKTHINGYRHLSEEYVEVKWTTLTQSAELGNKHWAGFTFTGSKYVAVGRDGYVSSSNDGTTWATATYVSELGSNNYWFGLAFNGSKFVAISNLGYISTSTDGNTWTTATWVQNIANGDWYEIIWGNGKFVAVGNQGHVSTSTNGTTWSATASSLGDHGYHALAFNGSKFVALSIDGYVTESTDGVNWSTPVQDSLLKSTYDDDTVANWWSSLVWDGYRFVATTRQYYNRPVYMATSEDGITWTKVVQDDNCTGTKIWDGTKIITMTGEGYLSSYTPVRDVINGTAIYYSVAQDGHKIITPDQVSKAELVYAATGASWYYVLDVTNSRFKLPKINPARVELGISAPVSGSVADLTNSTTIYCGKKYLYFYVGV